MRTPILIVIGIVAVVVALLIVGPLLDRHSQANAAPSVSNEPEIYASPVHAGCYIAGPSDCRIHVEPFTINIATSKKLVYFALIAIQFPGGAQTRIYDWRPDQSNPAPSSGTTYTPSLVAQDFAAACSKTYEISLQGQDTGDANGYNLGLTAQFTCPTGVP